MASARERIFMSAHWHVDCRLIAELPEDSVVGMRFITYAVSSVIALAAVLFTGWYAYADITLRHQIDDAQLHQEEERWEVIEIRRLQHFYEVESRKIENAYNEIKTPMLLSGFMNEVGKKLPDKMIIDAIDYTDGTIVIRGRLHESSEQASILLGAYLQKLRDDPQVGPKFTSITVTALDRSPEDEKMMSYAITMRIKPREK